jgi:hypothetical protein
VAHLLTLQRDILRSDHLLSAVELGDQRFGRNRSIGAIENEGDFIPINFIIDVEEKTQPIPEMAGAARRWAKESLWVDAHHGILKIRRCGAPERDTAVAAVVVMKIAKRKLVANKEARRAMAYALADLWQTEGDFPHASKFALLRLLHSTGQRVIRIARRVGSASAAKTASRF